MRKAISILLILLILVTSGSAIAVSKIAKSGKEISYEICNEYGDKSALDGLNIDISYRLGSHVAWNSKLTFRNQDFESMSETMLSQKNLRSWKHEDKNFFSVSLANNVDTYYYNDEEYMRVLPALREQMEKLAAEAKPGQQNTMQINLADYMEYYPLEFDIYYNRYGYNVTPLDDPTEEYPSCPKEYSDALLNYFKIPLQGDEIYEYLTEKDEEGHINLFEYNPLEDRSDFYHPYAISCNDDQAFYVCINNHTLQGKLVDTSQIPGGYGVYRIPLMEEVREADQSKVEKLDGSKIETICPIDPDAIIQGITMNASKDKLLLYTIENESLCLTVLDPDSGKVYQKLEISDADRAYDHYFAFRAEENEYQIIQALGRIFLIEEKAGTYHCKIASEPMNDTGNKISEDFIDADNDTYRFAYDGQRLAILRKALRLQSFERNKCGFYLAAYDGNGLTYYGEYISSLQAASDNQGGFSNDNSITVMENPDYCHINFKED